MFASLLHAQGRLCVCLRVGTAESGVAFSAPIEDGGWKNNGVSIRDKSDCLRFSPRRLPLFKSVIPRRIWMSRLQPLSAHVDIKPIYEMGTFILAREVCNWLLAIDYSWDWNFFRVREESYCWLQPKFFYGQSFCTHDVQNNVSIDCSSALFTLDWVCTWCNGLINDFLQTRLMWLVKPTFSCIIIFTLLRFRANFIRL